MIYLNFVGTYGVWGYDQPNDFDGAQDCGAMASSDNNFLLMDETCTEKHPYICDIRKCFRSNIINDKHQPKFICINGHQH